MSIEYSLSKQRRPWFDAVFCGIWAGSLLFAHVPQKHARFIMGALINGRVNELKFNNIVNMYENIDILSYSN